ncbi:hypothetical protein TNCV_1561601 [Trichonephila clavipes]|nr:hypothetical protein TNCV_1561601 [Trichonephila clavipes]
MLTEGVVLFRGNACPNMARRNAAVSSEFYSELFDHSPYSPDNDPSYCLASKEIPVLCETEKSQMAEIREARGRVKASLIRQENTFDEINTRNEISIQLSRLDDFFKEFERLDSNLSVEESELQEFEERYFYLNAKFNHKLDELNVQNLGRTQNSQ